jgi:hypothetical protein
MSENVGAMSPETMAQEMHRILVSLHPDEEGVDVATCLRHLKHHTLTPVIRLAMMLRNLLHLSDEMVMTLDRLGEDVDLKVVETFLKLQSQILLVYKNPDTNKMLFADRVL